MNTIYARKRSGLLFAAALLYSLLAIFVCIQTADATAWEGYHPISSKADLQNIRNNLSGKYYLTTDIVFESQDFAPGGAFYNGGEGWVPLGTKNTPFSGILDGNGHSISNLVIQSQTNGMLGFIGVNNGTIKNLQFYNLSVSFTTDVYTGAVNIGGIVGNNQFEGIIHNCSVLGQSSVSCSVIHTTCIGGISGNNNCMISNCSYSGTVVVSASSPSRDVFIQAGGITGMNFVGSITNCSNSGDISATGVATNSSRYVYCTVGGIAGSSGKDSSSLTFKDNPAYIKNSHNTGTVSTTVTSSINSLADYPNYASGIVGYNSGLVENCYNTGDISATLTTRLSCQDTNAAGIASVNDGTVTQCYNTGIIRTYCSYYTNAGGIVAYNGGSVSICSNLNAVYVISASTDDLYGSIGGIVGCNIKSLSDCYNVGPVHPPQYGYSFSSGGLVGMNADPKDEGLCCVERCYTIIAPDKSACYGPNFNGNLVSAGISEINNAGCIIRDCYYLDIVSAGILKGDGTATKCTMAEMKRAATYKNFDFSSVWTIDETGEYPLPTFRSHPEFPKGTISCKQHYFSEETITKSALCTISGETRSYCKVCNYCKTETVPAEGHRYDHTCDSDCNICGETRSITHKYAAAWSKNKTNHWLECSVCKEKKNSATHTPGPSATKTTAQTCTICDYEIAPALGTESASPTNDTNADAEENTMPTDAKENSVPTDAIENSVPTETKESTAPLEQKTPSLNNSPWWIIFVAIVVIGSCAAAFVIIKNRKN